MTILVCDINPFTALQNIYTTTDESLEVMINIGQAKLPNLYNFVPNYCHNNDITEVRFIGNPDLCNGIIQQATQYEKDNYANNDPIHMEVVQQ